MDDTAEPSKQSEMDANEKHGTQCVVPPGIKQGKLWPATWSCDVCVQLSNRMLASAGSDDVGGAVVMSKTQRRRLAKKQNGGHPARYPVFTEPVVGSNLFRQDLLILRRLRILVQSEAGYSLRCGRSWSGCCF